MRVYTLSDKILSGFLSYSEVFFQNFLRLWCDWVSCKINVMLLNCKQTSCLYSVYLKCLSQVMLIKAKTGCICHMSYAYVRLTNLAEYYHLAEEQSEANVKVSWEKFFHMMSKIISAEYCHLDASIRVQRLQILIVKAFLYFLL